MRVLAGADDPAEITGGGPNKAHELRTKTPRIQTKRVVMRAVSLDFSGF